MRVCCRVENKIVKPLKFIGTARNDLRSFPEDVVDDAGFELYQIQLGEEASDWKPMSSIGKGVAEIRIKSQSGAFRVIYVAKFESAVFVLHCFQKKTQKTETRDIELAKKRFNQLVKDIQNGQYYEN